MLTFDFSHLYYIFEKSDKELRNKSELLEFYRKVVVLMGWKSLVDKAAFW